MQEIESKIDKNLEYKVDAKAHYLTKENIWSAMSMNMDKQLSMYALVRRKAYNPLKVR